MNVLVLNYEYPPLGGGAAPFCQDLSEAYVRLGHQVDVITMGFRGLPSHEVSNGVSITRVPALRKRQETCETLEMLSYVISAFPRTLGMLKKRKIDAIHCHFIVPTGLLAYLVSFFTKIPYVITAHGSDVIGYNPDRFTKEHRFLRPLLRRIIGRAGGISAPSLFLGRLINRNIGDYAVRHLPYGIEVNKYTVGKKRKRILIMSRLLPRKGFQYILEALDGVETDFELHIAGDGPMRGELEERAKSLKAKVHFHGWLDHDSPAFRELFATSAIFCLPSECDNYPVSLMEAMAAGMAIVTSDVSGCPEVVGDAACLVGPHDVPMMRETLCGLMASEERRKELGSKARKRAVETFGLDVVGANYLTMLDEALETE